MKQEFLGWACRMWIETSENGWVSNTEVFDTREEAEAKGRTFNSMIDHDDLSREYEIFKEYTV